MFSERFILGMLIITILVLGGLIFSVVLWLLIKLQWWFIPMILAFFLWMSFSNWLDKRGKSKVMRIVSRFVSMPVQIVFLLVALAQPFITIVGSYFFVALFAFGLPALILIGLTYSCNWGLLPETIAFIVLSGGTILCANSYRMTKWIIKRTPLRNMDNHRYEGYREKLAFYVIHPSNVIFLIYCLYFVFLFTTGFIQIQNDGNLLPDGYDLVVLKAFLVFIAFTNMRTKAKVAELDSKMLLKQTMGLFEFSK